jgi:hypothetical protein
MQPEIHPTEAALQPPPSDLLPAQSRKGVPRVTAILGVGLLAAATFLAGIEAQKQWGGSSSGNGRLGARAAAFAAGPGAGTGTATGTAGANGAQGAPGAGSGVFRRGGGGLTTGTVKLVQGSTIYVTTANGNTVKVSVPAATAITKSVTTKLSGVHPGDTVTAIGTASSDGVIKATTVRLGDTGFPGFGGGGFGRRTGAQGANGQNGAPPTTTGG